MSELEFIALVIVLWLNFAFIHFALKRIADLLTDIHIELMRQRPPASERDSEGGAA